MAVALSLVGETSRVQVRSAVTASDAAYPTASNAGVAVPAGPSGAVAHWLVNITADDASGAAVVTIFGYVSALSRWYVLAQLNNGTAITRTTGTPVADGNNVHYAETLAHVSAYDRIHAMVTSIAGLRASIDVDVLHEV